MATKSPSVQGATAQPEWPTTQVAAIRFFADLDNCHNFMVETRWSGKVRCPHCNSDKVGKFSATRRVSNCKNKTCKKQFSTKVGTIFEDSPIGLDKWLAAVWMVVNAKNGVSSCELSRNLGVTQKTAWFMAHRIRLAVEKGTFNKLDGVVEVDESYIGGLARNMHKSTKKRRGISGAGVWGKTAVMGLLERHTNERSSRIVGKVLKAPTKEELHYTIREYVEPASELHTDKLPAYKGIEPEYFHKVVDHAECYVKDGVHTNGLENFWSLLKRSIKGTYVQCAPFHLHRYLGEQVFRFNERKLDDFGRFALAVSMINDKKLSYQKLIGADSATPA